MRSALPLLLLAACTSELPRIEGKVVDIWGHPIAGARVIVIGQTERPLTDEHGRYRVPFEPGEWEIKAGRDGYIPDAKRFEIVDMESRAPTFQLYQKPEERGFYVFGSGQYHPVVPTEVRSVGSALGAHRGMESIGDAAGQGPQLRVLFHTELKEDEINRLGLELVRLDYMREAEVASAMGSSNVKINLYIAKAPVPFEQKTLRSGTDYLLTVDELQAGSYAFHTQEILDDMPREAFAETPPELRIAWPFSIR